MLQGTNAYLVGGALVLLLLLLLVTRRRAGSRKPQSAEEQAPEIKKWLQKGDYQRAAQAAIDAKNLPAAIELFMRAQQPEAAAQVAVRAGDFKQAAELFERAHQWQRAETYYERAGMTEQAEVLRKKHGMQKAQAVAPASRGRELEADYRKQAAGADVSDAPRLQDLAREAADALLAEGEMRQAADLFRDADLDDEAIHLYVNVLGLPGSAAPLLARNGQHERAAEMYEIAGERERAASSWVEVARASQKPELLIDRIEALSRDTALHFLETETQRRKLAAETAELFYRFAVVLAKLGETARALGVFRQIRTVVPGYADIDDQITTLAAGQPIEEEPAEVVSARTRTNPGPASALSPEQIKALTDEVARAAAEQLRNQADLRLKSLSVPPGAAAPQVAAGLEGPSVKVDLLFDPVVQLAKAGPTIEQLRRFINERPCDLQNIEVYYRIGLVHTGNGQYNEALEAFDAVEEASPGYRDAWRRAAVIREWLRAVAPRATQFSGGGGRYAILGELGRGGMAVVYRAHDKMLGREVALKFLSETLAAQKDMQELFQREARAVASLNHPNIVTIHDVGMLDGRAFLCMELVDGASLETLMTQEPGLTIVESLRAIRQVLQALAYAHERKIIHRDIKPANMMRTESGLVKLMDFGLAKSLDSRNKKSVLAGTPQFMAPEQLRGEEADHRADLFAVGVTLYELLTGCLPYDGYDRAAPPRRVIDHVPAVPAVLDQAIMRALEPDKTKRQQSASELSGPIVQVLEAVARTTGQKAPSGPVPAAANEYRDPRDSVTFKR